MPNSLVQLCAHCCRSVTSSCVIQQRVKKLEDASKKMETDTKKYANMNLKIKGAKQELEDMCERTQVMLNQEYSTLLDLLKHNQQQAFILLNNYKETMKQKLHQLDDDTQNFHQKSTSMVKSIQQLSNRQETENPASLLGEISAMETSLATIDDFYSTIEDELKVDHTRLKALENSVKKIVEKNKELLPRPWEFLEEITLDDSRKQGSVKISEDRTEMWVSPHHGGPDSTSSSAWCSVLASQRFKEGLHYWEVFVGGSESWLVGIAERGWWGKDVKYDALGHNKSSWVLECDGGNLSALHNSDYSNVKESDMHTLGVFLDCDKGRVKFYNVSTGIVLHSFITKFKRPVCPTFSIRSQNGATARLKICSLISREDSPCNSDTKSLSGESTESAYSSN